MSSARRLAVLSPTYAKSRSSRILLICRLPTARARSLIPLFVPPPFPLRLRPAYGDGREGAAIVKTESSTPRRRSRRRRRERLLAPRRRSLRLLAASQPSLKPHRRRS